LKTGESECDGILLPEKSTGTKSLIKEIFGADGSQNAFITHKLVFNLLKKERLETMEIPGKQPMSPLIEGCDDLFGENKKEHEALILKKKELNVTNVGNITEDVDDDDDEKDFLDENTIVFIEIKSTSSPKSVNEGIYQLISRNLSFLLFKVIAFFKNQQGLTPFFNSLEKKISNEQLLKRTKAKLFLIYNGDAANIDPEMIRQSIEEVKKSTSIQEIFSIFNEDQTKKLVSEFFNSTQIYFIYTTIETMEKMQIQKHFQDLMKNVEEKVENRMGNLENRMGNLEAEFNELNRTMKLIWSFLSGKDLKNQDIQED